MSTFCKASVAEVRDAAVLADAGLAESRHGALVEDAGVLRLGIVSSLEHDHGLVHLERRNEAHHRAAEAARLVALVEVGLADAAVLRRRVVLEGKLRKPW